MGWDRANRGGGIGQTGRGGGEEKGGRGTPASQYFISVIKIKGQCIYKKNIFSPKKGSDLEMAIPKTSTKKTPPLSTCFILWQNP